MKRIIHTFLLLLACTLVSQAQMAPKCYVVVGAFKIKQNANNYVNYLATKSLTAEFKLNTYRNLYYVYSFVSEEREPAKEELFKVRDNYPELQKAWLYAGDFKGPHIPSTEWESFVSAPANDLGQDNNQQETIENAEEDIDTNTSSLADADTKTEDSGQAEKAETEQSDKGDAEPQAPEVEGKWKVYINAVNNTNFKEVSGKFLYYDAERNQQIGELEAHQLVGIEDPNNRTNRLKFESDIFGFHEFAFTVDMDEPEKEDELDVVEVMGDTIMFNVKLARLKQGDISTLWKVYFYKDAAIMKEESVYELNQLLGLLQENDNMEIRIHGHTNGNSHGPVLHLDLDDKQFFAINGTHEETYASAKKLSLYRAYTIQHWLMDQGITEDRIDIKGWGGKKMIYDKFDSQAEKNVRVEIEILKD